MQQSHLEYKFSAERGEVILEKDKYFYYAPFTGGEDIVKFEVFDKTDNKALPTITQKVNIQGVALTYVDFKDNKTTSIENTNGSIKVVSFKDLITAKKEIGLGRYPIISPDGKYIAYTKYSNDGTTSQLFIKNVLGKEINIINDPSFNLNPSWAPIPTEKDKKYSLVFSSNKNGGIYHLWKIDIDGKNLKQLTNSIANDYQPSYSPDGTQIAFTSDLQDNKINSFRNLFILDINSNKQAQYTFETISNKGVFNPEWSLDSKRVIYSRKYQKRQLQYLNNFQKIWLIDFTRNSQGFGQIVTREFDENIVETYPCFYPNNRQFSFIRHRGESNAFVSLDISFSTYYGARVFAIEPDLEPQIEDITDAKWARQKYIGNLTTGIYQDNNNEYLNNPFTPTTGSSI